MTIAGTAPLAKADALCLSSDRLTLRPIGVVDMQAIVALHCEHRVASQLVDGVPDTLSKAFSCILWNRPMQEKGFGTFAVQRRGDPAMIGLFSLTPFNDDETLLELGGKLVPSAWRGGLAIEAGGRMIVHAFDTLGRDRLVSAFHPDNRSAPASLARLGFVAAAPTELFGRPVSTMTLSRADWEAQGGVARRASRCDYGSEEPARAYELQDGPPLRAAEKDLCDDGR